MKSRRQRMRNIFLGILSCALLAVLILSIVYITRQQGDAMQTAVDESAKRELADREQENKESAGNRILINEIGSLEDIAWVELYNPSNYDVEITGYQISDETGDPVATIDGKTVIKSNGYFVIEVGKKTEFDETSTNMCFCDPKGVVINKVPIPQILNGESYGRRTDGVLSFQFLTPTKGESNNSAEIVAKNYPVFSVPSGFYSDEFELEIIISDDYEVYYTTDGSKPTIESEVYEGPITINDASSNPNDISARTDFTLNSTVMPNNKIDKATVIRAVAVDRNGAFGIESTATYFVGYSAKPGYDNIPIISVYTEKEELTNYWDGLLVTGKTYDEARIAELNTYLVANYWKDIEKEVCIQFFEPNGTMSYEGVAGIKTYKDICLNSIQKSLEITGIDGDRAGSSSLFDFLGDGTLSGIVLDAGRNDLSVKIRNALIQQLMKGRECLVVDNRLCALFLNGEYWGVYNIQQKINEEFIAYVFNLEKDDVLLYRNGYAISGKAGDQALVDETITFFSETDLSDATNYMAAKSLVDIESMLDCYATMIYTANSEWQSGDVYMWRTRKISPEGYSDGKWHYIIAETDSSLGLNTLSGYTMNTFLRPALHNDMIFSSFMRNDEFREKLIERIEELAKNVFTAENVNEQLGEMVERSLAPVNRSYQRFYNVTITDYIKETAQNITDFVENRMDYLSVYMQNELTNSSFKIEAQE